MKPKTCLPLATLAAALLLVGSGCTVPVFDHPLTDDATSTVDGRLLGAWKPVATDESEKPPFSMLLVGLEPKAQNTLELVTIEMDDENHIQIKQLKAYTAVLDMVHYVSIRAEEDGEVKYLVMMYRHGDGETVRAYMVKNQAIGAAIEAGEIKGIAQREKRAVGTPEPPDGPRYTTLNITAETEELVAFIRKKGESLFDLDHPLTMRRVPSP